MISSLRYMMHTLQLIVNKCFTSEIRNKHFCKRSINMGALLSKCSYSGFRLKRTR